MNPLPRIVRERAARGVRRAPRRAAAFVAAVAVVLPALGALPASASPGSPGSSPTAAGEEMIDWVEVEDGTISGGAAGPPAFNSGDHGNFSGTGSYTFRETGMTSEMTVTAPAAGTYPIHVRYAAGPLSPAENV